MINKFGIRVLVLVFCCLLYGNVVKAAEVEVNCRIDNRYMEAGKAVQVDNPKNYELKWYVDDRYVSEETYIPSENDYEKWIKVEAYDAGILVDCDQVYFSKLPVCYIDTKDSGAITSKTEYKDASLQVQNNEKCNDYLYNGDTQIKGRGNSTWELPKKPYKLKLAKKADLFGNGTNKHYVLLANYLDEGLMRNTIAFDISKKLGLYTVRTNWVDVVLNGEYVGNYQLCEQIRVGANRVNVKNWESEAEKIANSISKTEIRKGTMSENDIVALETMMVQDLSWITSGVVKYNGVEYQVDNYVNDYDSDISGGYLFELSNEYDEISKFMTNMGLKIMVNAPEYCFSNSVMAEYVQELWQNFENAYTSEDGNVLIKGTPYHYSELADMDSMISYWLCMEITGNNDAVWKSRYAYIDQNKRLTFGPVWDFDYGCGAWVVGNNASDWKISENASELNFYKEWCDDPYFLVKAREKYWSIRPFLQSLIEDGGIFDSYHDYLEESGKADEKRWNRAAFWSTTYRGFETDAKLFKKYMMERIAWLDEQFASDSSIVSSLYTTTSAHPYEQSSELTISLENTLIDNNSKNDTSDVFLDDNKVLDVTITSTNPDIATYCVYVNGRKYDTYVNAENSAKFTISASVFTEKTGTKNVVNVIAKDLDNNTVCTNFVTVIISGEDVVSINDALVQYNYTNETPSENLTEGNQEGGYLPTAGILSGQSRLFASVDGVNKRKLEWSKDVYAPLEGSVPVMTAGEKNPWSGNEKNYPYFEIKASTKGYQSLIFHADLGATKKGPKDWGLLYSLDGVTFHPVVASGSAVTYSLTDNKTLQTAFDGIPLPEELENQECVYLRIQGTSFDTLGETSYCSGIGGEAAINNISLSGVAMEQQEKNEYVAGTPYKVEDGEFVYDVSVPHVVIHALYGNNTSSVVSPSAVSHNFIELYNPTDHDVSLKGWSLQYRSSGAGDNSSGWSQFAFDENAVIGAHSSYLVRGNELQYTEENAVQITRADAEWNISFSNEGGSVVLSYDNDSLMIDSAVQSQNVGVRRKDTFVNGYIIPVDTDDNRVEGYGESSEDSDWIMVDYSVNNEAYRNWALPRSSEDGVWNTEAVCPIYTVTWNLNYDSAENVSATQKYGYAFSKITDPERKGYVFEGWYLDSDGSLAYNFEEKPSSDVKLYAKWKKIEYSIRYHLNAGVNAATNPEQYTVEDEVIFTQPEKEGYAFEGWYSEEAFEHKVDGITKGTIGDVALYAKWKEIEVSSTAEPTVNPTLQPTVDPTFQPAVQPTLNPVIQPTEQPAIEETTLIDISDAVVSKIPKRKYTGRKMKPVVVVTYAGCTLKKGKDYTISYKNNRKVGKAKVIIKGKGIYTGKKQITFLIVESYKQYKVKSDVVLRRKASKTAQSIRSIQTGQSIKLVKGYHKKSKSGHWYKVKVGKNYYYVLLKKPVKM